jgi:chromate reductase, NAD(P)H dehydrogenase (quinone)
VRVLAISGSLRGGSHNTMLLRAAAALAPEGVEVELYEGLKRVPPYDEDDDRDPAPAEVTRLREAVAGADALLVATPEYNHSLPGQLKTALDWLSRPRAASALHNLPAAVVGASTGAFGAIWSQAEVRKVLAAAGARVVEDDVAVGHAHEAFDADGGLVSEEHAAQLREVLAELVAQVEARSVAA